MQAASARGAQGALEVWGCVLLSCTASVSLVTVLRVSSRCRRLQAGDLEEAGTAQENDRDAVGAGEDGDDIVGEAFGGHRREEQLEDAAAEDREAAGATVDDDGVALRDEDEERSGAQEEGESVLGGGGGGGDEVTDDETL